MYELSFASASKRVFVRNHSYVNMFSLKVHFHAKVKLIFCTKTRLETEVDDNSLMVYLLCQQFLGGILKCSSRKLGYMYSIGKHIFGVFVQQYLPPKKLFFRVERRHCLISTSYMTGFLTIFILLHV